MRMLASLIKTNIWRELNVFDNNFEIKSTLSIHYQLKKCLQYKQVILFAHVTRK